VGIEGGTAHQIRLPPGVVHHQVGLRVADDDQPVPGAGGPLHRAPMDLDPGEGDPEPIPDTAWVLAEAGPPRDCLRRWFYSLESHTQAAVLQEVA
jgi:hypothetical protein